MSKKPELNEKKVLQEELEQVSGGGGALSPGAVNPALAVMDGTIQRIEGIPTPIVEPDVIIFK